MAAASEPRLILASASPARRHLLRAAGIDFVTQPAAVDEVVIKRRFLAEIANARDCASSLAEAKAVQVSNEHPRAIVIGADQILVCGAKWFDKPPDVAAARRQLQALRGRRHILETAACAVRRGHRLWVGASAPQLTMRRFSDAFLETYLAEEGTAVLGSVGAYRLEGRGVQLFEQIEGDHFAVLGLPLIPLLEFLREEGQLAR